MTRDERRGVLEAELAELEALERRGRLIVDALEHARNRTIGTRALEAIRRRRQQLVNAIVTLAAGRARGRTTGPACPHCGVVLVNVLAVMTGRAGGLARARTLTPERRRAIAQQAAAVRWSARARASP